MLKGAEPIIVRPGSLLRRRRPRRRAQDRGGEASAAPPSDRELASYLMYPKVFADFAAAQETYGPTEVLPTPVYFYGLAAGEEISVELEKGKTLVVRCQAIGEADDGRAGARLLRAERPAAHRPRARPRARRRPPAPAGRRPSPATRRMSPRRCRASISGVSVAAGQEIRAGDVLLSIEAMKMETALHADRDGKVAEVLVKTGDQIDAKDLLVRFE